MRSPAQRRPLI